MELGELFYYAVVILIFFIILDKLGIDIGSILAVFLSPNKRPRIRARDVMQVQYKKRKKVAKRNLRGLKIKGIVFKGDKDHPPIIYKRIVGIIPDPRCYEFFIGVGFGFALWVLIPTETIENLNSKFIRVDGRGLKPLGFNYTITVNSVKKDRIEIIERTINRYVDNVLRKEQKALLDELRVHASITGAETDEISIDLTTREEQIAPHETESISSGGTD